jgi:D-alanyl-D-alanine carboxypeptidase/D-alanyl-D-alanine-endopeptidase (penicillin-binding protein 4)
MPVDILLTPLSTYYTITNNTQTTTPDAGKFVFSRNWLENGNDLIVSGNVERKRTTRVNIYEPEKFFMHTLQERLEAYGMQFSNRYAFKEMLPIDSCSLLMAYETPIQAVLDEMMKESDNLNAEAMLYRLAWQATGKRHLSSDEAIKPLQERIDALGYKASNYRIVDGCGLSNYNAVSAELLVSFLRFAYSQPDIYSAIYQALPIAGIDGTLQSRMRRGSPAYRNVRAKTGTVTGICTLAGYLTASNGHQIAFAILNQNHLAHRDARLLQDKVCEFLCGYR